MCGIIGYIGSQSASQIILSGLKRIEYRGYDSAGLSVVDSNNILKTAKVKGGVEDLAKTLAVQDFAGKVGIGHTRWATHGEPSKLNAHPHTSTRFSIVHNGIIENYQDLKKEVQQAGYSNFISQTDSEVLVWMIEQEFSKTRDVQVAIANSLKRVRGTFGLAIISTLTPNNLYLAKRGSPLLIGESKKAKHATSDASTLPRSVDNVTYLEDDQLAVLTRGSMEVFNLHGAKQKTHAEAFDSAYQASSKGEYAHFLLKEIYDQPESATETLRGRLDIKNNDAMLGGLEDYSEREANKLTHITSVACGTAYYSSVLSSYLLEDIVDLPMDAHMASEFLYRSTPITGEETLGLVISQSGETADTIAATKKLKKLGAHTHGAVNVIGSTIARLTDSGTYLYVGPEISVASTKAFTSQVIAQLLLGLKLNALRGNPVKNNAEVIAALEKLPQDIEQTLKNVAPAAKRLALAQKNLDHAMYLGRNSMFPVALEGALKLKEISYVQTEAHPGGEMKHGPLALVDDEMLVVFLIRDDELFEKSLSNLKEVEARGSNVLIITDSKKLADEKEQSILVPKSSKYTAPLLFNIPLQLFAYHIANNKHLSVDKPRNLAKSVTVE